MPKQEYWLAISLCLPPTHTGDTSSTLTQVEGWTWFPSHSGIPSFSSKLKFKHIYRNLVHDQLQRLCPSLVVDQVVLTRSSPLLLLQAPLPHLLLSACLAPIGASFTHPSAPVDTKALQGCYHPSHLVPTTLRLGVRTYTPPSPRQPSFGELLYIAHCAWCVGASIGHHM